MRKTSGEGDLIKVWPQVHILSLKQLKTHFLVSFFWVLGHNGIHPRTYKYSKLVCALPFQVLYTAVHEHISSHPTQVFYKEFDLKFRHTQSNKVLIIYYICSKNMCTVLLSFSIPIIAMFWHIIKLSYCFLFLYTVTTYATTILSPWK